MVEMKFLLMFTGFNFEASSAVRKSSLASFIKRLKCFQAFLMFLDYFFSIFRSPETLPSVPVMVIFRIIFLHFGMRKKIYIMNVPSLETIWNV